MLLSFREPSDVVKSFNQVDIPSFAVVTGPNGSGKTQLLTAIARGALAFEGIKTTETLFLQPHMIAMQPHDEEYHPSSAAQGQHLQPANDIMRSGVLKSIDSARQSCFGQDWPRIESFFAENNYVIETFSDIDLQSFLDTGFIDLNDYKNLDRYLDQLHVLKVSRDQDGLTFSFWTIACFSKLSYFLGKSLHKITIREVQEHLDIFTSAGRANYIFDFSVSIQFKMYQSRKFWNDFRRYRHQHLGKTSDSYLDADAFRRRYGPPPWELANEVINRVRGLRYYFKEPSDDPEESYKAHLYDSRDGRSVPMHVLSSGESILLRIVSAIYTHSRADGRMLRPPKLLLLDEPDSSLHPSMVKHLLSLIRNEFVKNMQMRVILTTHSPTTVMLSPEEAVYEVDILAGSLTKKDKSLIVDSLCEGVVRVSESKRIIFVEGANDAAFLELSKRLLISSGVISENNLLFLPPFRVPKVDNIAAARTYTNGRDIVRRLTSVFDELGNTDMFGGLIDWDGENEEGSSLYVLPRWEIENYIWDPIVVFSALLSQGVNLLPEMGLVKTDAFKLYKLAGVESGDSERLQRIANAVVQKIESHMKFDMSNKTCTGLDKISKDNYLRKLKDLSIILYANGMSVKVPAWWLRWDGDDLRTASIAAFGYKFGKYEVMLEAYEGLELIPHELTDLYLRLSQRSFRSKI